MPFVLSIDADQLEGMALLVGLTRDAMVKASKRAARRAVRWGRVQVARGLAARLGVPQGALAGRRMKASSRRNGARLWIALNPLNVAKANPRKYAKGIRAGRQEFEGAFVMSSKRGGLAGVRRKGSARYPLESAAFNVLTPGMDEIERKTWPALNEQFLAFYREELERIRRA